MLFPNASCDGWVAPNGPVWVEVDSEPPKAGCWPKTDDPRKQENQFSDWIRKLTANIMKKEENESNDTNGHNLDITNSGIE